MSQLSLRALHKAYGAYHVFDDLNLEVAEGEIVVIFGGSGTGKTILLRLIAGVDEPTSGSIAIAGADVVDVPPEHRGIGMAFQNFALFPHMSAEQNIASPLVARNASAQAITAGVNEVAKLLKIDHVMGHSPRELSNGQKQRTALARALAAKPKILLLDDPLRNVDAKLRFEMRLELPRLLRQKGATVLYVTQDYKEAMALADRIAVLHGGRFIQVAAPEDIYMRPATLNVARLFGDPAINTAETKVEVKAKAPHVTIFGATVPLPKAYATWVGHEVTFGVRPEAVVIETAKGSLPAEVMAVTPLNERVVLLLKSAGGWEFLASLPSSSRRIPEPGDTVQTTFLAEGTHLFDQKTGERLHG
jgi:multiple sugar transport system ATP-binding protein